ncbi:MAG: 2-oxoacid:acceptor oxidoreductase family protein [Deltaproteobacteria bacterium]|nr:2-oxoacid:acceptor oxidoreductase family protein [Deltaproteobacteria bacterium]
MEKRRAEGVHAEEDSAAGLHGTIQMPLEIRVHGRGGQGGVTCAKLIAAVYARTGLYVQTFGDYGAERSGAPVRAFTRVDHLPIKNRNKVYHPDHLLVLDSGLLGPLVLEGVSSGSVLLVNSTDSAESLADQFPSFKLGVIDATAIAREHGIGTSAVVIINTTIVGSYARMLDLPMAAVEYVYSSLGLSDDLAAAHEAYDSVVILPVRQPGGKGNPIAPVQVPIPPVLPQTEHCLDIPTTLQTGTWSSQTPSYQEYEAPCNRACPAGNDVVGFIQALKNDGPEAAAEVLLKTQPLPSVCGRVCPAPCMTECNRKFLDGAVNIRSLERWISGRAQVQLEKKQPLLKKDFAVVGSGPAGLSAAYHLTLEGHRVVVYEKMAMAGGVLRYGIPRYRLPDDMLHRDLDRIIALGVTFRYNHPLDRAGLLKLHDEYDGVIVCKGFGDAYAIGVAGEDLGGVEQGLDYLAGSKESIRQLGGTVLVVGGGNTAIDCARSALRSGASSVKLIYRRSREEMPAIAEEVEEACREGVQVLTWRQPVGFVGNKTVCGVVLAEVDPGPPGKDGRRTPVITDRTFELDCNTVLLALGQDRKLNLLPDSWRIEEARAWEEENPLNVWFAGDCRTGDGTVAHAIGHGRMTAYSALADIDTSPAAGYAEKVYKSVVAPAHIRFSHFPVIPPHSDRHRSVSSYQNNFEEVNLGLSGQEEAERCFSCGRCTFCDTCLVYCPDGVIYRTETGYRIDEAYCKGCGICVVECPRRAMEMHEK